MARDDGASADLHLNREGGNVVIGAASGGSSMLTTPVLQITGGSDLSEMFDIGGTTQIQPGMVVVYRLKQPWSTRPRNPAIRQKSGRDR